MRIVEHQTGVGQLTVVSAEFLADITDAIEGDAQRFVPVDTGELRDSIEQEVVSTETRRVWARAPHAMDVEFGTRAHVIEPDQKQALAWPGGAHPVARVNHPGTKAQPYLRPALYRKRRGR